MLEMFDSIFRWFLKVIGYSFFSSEHYILKGKPQFTKRPQQFSKIELEILKSISMPRQLNEGCNWSKDLRYSKKLIEKSQTEQFGFPVMRLSTLPPPQQFASSFREMRLSTPYKEDG